MFWNKKKKEMYSKLYDAQIKLAEMEGEQAQKKQAFMDSLRKCHECKCVIHKDDAQKIQVSDSGLQSSTLASIWSGHYHHYWGSALKETPSEIKSEDDDYRYYCQVHRVDADRVVNGELKKFEVEEEQRAGKKTGVSQETTKKKKGRKQTNCRVCGFKAKTYRGLRVDQSVAHDLPGDSVQY